MLLGSNRYYAALFLLLLLLISAITYKALIKTVVE
jgi:hypothetical protein